MVKVVEPGGVTATRFGQRSAGEAKDAVRLPDYDAFVAGAEKIFAGLRASRGNATSEEVAEVILEAATDGSDRLRDVATEDIKPLIAARRETSEDEYLAFMRARVAPKLGG